MSFVSQYSLGYFFFVFSVAYAVCPVIPLKYYIEGVEIGKREMGKAYQIQESHLQHLLGKVWRDSGTNCLTY